MTTTQLRSDDPSIDGDAPAVPFAEPEIEAPIDQLRRAHPLTITRREYRMFLLAIVGSARDVSVMVVLPSSRKAPARLQPPSAGCRLLVLKRVEHVQT